MSYNTHTNTYSNNNTDNNNNDFQTIQRRGGKVAQLQQHIKNLQRRCNSPKTDLLETDDVFIVRMELPVTSYRWELKEEQILLVTYQKEQFEFEGAKEIYRESRHGQSMRRVKLPAKVNARPFSESYTNGIWVVKFAKQSNAEHQQSQPTQPLIDFEKLSVADVSGSWADEI
jgi:HSP20 family molecular chaperone IbpA